jgi:hypothetical protein
MGEGRVRVIPKARDFHTLGPFSAMQALPYRLWYMVEPHDDSCGLLKEEPGMRLRVLAGAALAVVMLAGAASCAGILPTTGLSFDAGVYRPSDSDTRDALGDTWIGGQVSYKQKQVGPVTGELTLGYYKAEGRSFADTDGTVETDGYIIPMVYRTKTTVPLTGMYYGGGVGAYYVNVEGIDGDGILTSGASESGTKLGWELFGGMKVFGPLNAELAYRNIRGDVAGLGMSGWSLTVKGKF